MTGHGYCGCVITLIFIPMASKDAQRTAKERGYGTRETFPAFNMVLSNRTNKGWKTCQQTQAINTWPSSSTDARSQSNKACVLLLENNQQQTWRLAMFDAPLHDA
jgi:hypothetical protein